MRRISLLLFLLVFCSATAMQAQAPAPKPGPEAKKLSVYLGHWTYEGESKPGPGALAVSSLANETFGGFSGVSTLKPE
jgi:hypothetical protein